MAHWTHEIKTKVDNLELEFNKTKTNLEDLEESLIQLKTNCNDAVTQLNTEKDDLPNKVNEILAPVISEAKTKLKNLEASFIQEKANCNDAITKLNTEKNDLPNKVNEILTPVINDANTKFQKVENSQNDKIKNHIDEKLKETESLIRAQRLNVGKEITELKDSYKGVKDSKIKEAVGLLKSFKNIVEEKEKQINQLLKDSGIAKDAITQEALSKKNFDLADIKEKNAIHAEKLLRNTLIAITALFIVSFYKIIFTDNSSLSEAEILFRITLAIPLSIYAYIQSKKINRESRLRDQYHHKGVSLASYSGFITRIEEDESIPNDKKIHLLETTFEQVLDNAVDKTDNYEIRKLKLMQQVSTNIFRICSKMKNDTGDTLNNFFEAFGVRKNKSKKVKDEVATSESEGN